MKSKLSSSLRVTIILSHPSKQLIVNYSCSTMNNSNHNMETPKKIMEPLITIPKPRPSMVQHHQQPKTPNNVSMKLPVGGTSKYAELLHVIEELGQHIRPSYAGHRGSSEKIKQGIIKARVLVKECIVETERSARQ